MCSWFPLMQMIWGWLRTKATSSAEAGPRSIMSPRQMTRSSGLSFNRWRRARKVARCPWRSPTAKRRWPSSMRACNSASSDGSRSEGPSGRFNLQLKLFTEEKFPSVNGCLNHYMFFPLQQGVKSRFCDPFPPPSDVHHSVLSAGSSALASSSAAAAVANESLSVDALPAPTMPMAIMATPPIQNRRVTQSIHESKFVQ